MPTTHDVRSSPAGLTRRLLARSICASCLLLVLGMGVIWYAGQRTFYNEVVPEFRRQAQTVGADLAAQIRRAVDFGIPVDQLVGVPTLFEEFLKNHPRLAYVALDNPQGRLLFSAHQPDAARGPDPRRDVTISIDIEDRLIGTLHVGVRTLHRAEFLRLDLWHALILLVVALAAVAWAQAVLIRRDVLEPVTLVRLLCAAFARGSWNVQARELGAPETRAALAALNGAFDQIAERRRRIEWLASEVVDCASDRAEPIESLLGTLPDATPVRTRLLAPPDSVLSPAFLFFLVCLADQLVAWSVPLTGRPAGTLPAGTWPVTAGLAALVAASLLQGAVARLSRPALLFAACALLVAAGEALCLVRPAGMTLLTGRAAAAFGIAVLAIVCGCCTRAGARNGAMLTATASSVLVGAAAGPLLAEQLGGASCLIAAIFISLLVAPLGLNLQSSAGVPRGRRGRAARVTAPLAALAGASLVALAAAWLPGRGSAMVVSTAVAGYGLAVLGLVHRPRLAVAPRPRPR